MDQDSVNNSLQSLLAGDETHLPDLMEYYRPRLRRMVELRIGGMAGRVDPSDVLQDAFVEASRKITRFIETPRVSLFAWLRGLTSDALSNTRRHHITTQRRSVSREIALPSEGSAIFASKLIVQSSPSRHLAREELRLAITLSIGELKEVDREIILMRHFEELSNREVAEALGVGPSTVTMRHGRALARLKALLESRLRLSEWDR